jgi:hypothetical protein
MYPGEDRNVAERSARATDTFPRERAPASRPIAGGVKRLGD